jgi:hypothetical protein
MSRTSTDAGWVDGIFIFSDNYMPCDSLIEYTNKEFIGAQCLQRSATPHFVYTKSLAEDDR